MTKWKRVLISHMFWERIRRIIYSSIYFFHDFGCSVEIKITNFRNLCHQKKYLGVFIFNEKSRNIVFFVWLIRNFLFILDMHITKIFFPVANSKT